jgi:tetratricopeptide (TPR) repeat protein
LDRASTAHPARDAWRLWTLYIGSSALLAAGQFEEAAALAEEAESLARELGADPGAEAVAFTHALLVVVLLLLGDVERALAAARRGLSTEADTMPSVTARFAYGLAVASAGALIEGRQMVIDAIPALESWQLPMVEAEGLIYLGALAAIAEEWGRAAVLLAAARAIGRRFDDAWRSPGGFRLYARYLAEVRAHLDDTTARALRDQGRAMTAEEALAFGVSSSEAK